MNDHSCRLYDRGLRSDIESLERSKDPSDVRIDVGGWVRVRRLTELYTTDSRARGVLGRPGRPARHVRVRRPHRSGPEICGESVTSDDVLALFRQSGALLEGHFQL